MPTIGMALRRWRFAFVARHRDRFHNREFGVLEAIAFFYCVDIWLRYSAVVRAVLERNEAKRILDVGGGPGELAAFLDPNRYSITVCDMNHQQMEHAIERGLARVVADGCSLPFADASFDVVTSVDAIEHVPPPLRSKFMRELKRVARHRVILHAPVNDHSGNYDGESYDRRLNEFYRRVYRVDEPNTVEHLANGLPTINDLLSEFEGCHIIGRDNVKTWYRHMVLARIPGINLFAGLLYFLFLRGSDNVPPYHACLLVYDISAAKSTERLGKS